MIGKRHIGSLLIAIGLMVVLLHPPCLCESLSISDSHSSAHTCCHQDSSPEKSSCPSHASDDHLLGAISSSLHGFSADSYSPYLTALPIPVILKDSTALTLAHFSRGRSPSTINPPHFYINLRVIRL